MRDLPRQVLLDQRTLDVSRRRNLLARELRPFSASFYRILQSLCLSLDSIFRAADCGTSACLGVAVIRGLGRGCLLVSQAFADTLESVFVRRCHVACTETIVLGLRDANLVVLKEDTTLRLAERAKLRAILARVVAICIAGLYLTGGFLPRFLFVVRRRENRGDRVLTMVDHASQLHHGVLFV